MAGPSPMALGPFAFQALGFGFEHQHLDQQTPWAEIEVCERLDALQWTGPKSEAFDIKGALFPEEFGGEATLDGLKSAARAGLPLMLVTGAGRVFGMHVVMGISEERSFIKASGQPRKNAYTIKLRRTEAGGGALGALSSLF